MDLASKHNMELDLAIKFNNTRSTVDCCNCGNSFRPEVGYQITLRDTFDFVCDGCVQAHRPELIIGRDAIEESLEV